MKMSSRSFVRKQLIGLAAVGTMLGAGSAQADLIDGIVDAWTVGVMGQFDCGTASFEAGSGSSSCAAQTMSWGSTTTTSGLDISNLAPAVVNTNGPAVANTSVTHRNNVLPGGSTSLDSVVLQSTLSLTPFSPPAPGLPPQTLDFLIEFQETPNGGSGGVCADGGPTGVGINSNGCADIFVISQNALNFAFDYPLLNGNPGTQTYFISFFEQTGGLNPLPTAACLAATGSNAPCLGFRTAEGQDTTFQFAAVITTEPVSVPVPGTLAMLGLGLLGLGAVRRKKK